MTLSPGDRVLLQTGPNGVRIAIGTPTVAASDRVVNLPTGSGSIPVKVSTLSAGDRVVLENGANARRIALSLTPGTPLLWVSKYTNPDGDITCVVYIGGGIAVAAGANHIFRSVDYGDNWEIVQTIGSCPAGNVPYSLCDCGGGVLVMGTYYYGSSDPHGEFWKSIDYGVTWEKKQDISTSYYVMINAIISLGGGVCVAGTANTPGGGTAAEFWRSTNDGDSWTLVQTATTEYSILSLLDNGAGVLIAGTSRVGGGAAWRSGNGGASWSISGYLGGNVFCLTKIDSNTIFAGNGLLSPDSSIIAKSVNAGVTWAGVKTITDGYYVRGIIYMGNGLMFAGSWAAGVWKSRDYGATWTYMQGDYLSSFAKITSISGLACGGGTIYKLGT